MGSKPGCSIGSLSSLQWARRWATGCHAARGRDIRMSWGPEVLKLNISCVQACLRTDPSLSVPQRLPDHIGVCCSGEGSGGGGGGRGGGGGEGGGEGAGAERLTSGAMYSGVPQAVLHPDPRFSALLYPKSHSFTSGAPRELSIRQLSSCIAHHMIAVSWVHSLPDGGQLVPQRWQAMWEQTNP